MKQLYSLFRKEFAKNVLTLITGSALSQIILYVVLPILTRLFSEEVFGVYLLFIASIFILKPITSLRLELSILLPKEDKDAINLVFFSFFFSFCCNILLFIGLIIFKDFIIDFFNLKKFSFFIYLLPVSLFLLNIIDTITYWNNRNSNFKSIASSNVVKAITTSSSQTYTGLSLFKSLGLIPGYILGQFLQFVFLSFTALKSFKGKYQFLSFRRMFSLLKKYKDIPIYNSLLTFNNQFSTELPIILITNFFGLASAGVYGLATKLLKAPVGIVSQSVSQVFFNEASKLYNVNGNVQELVIKTYKKLILIGLLLFSFLFIISYFLDVILGNNWKDVGIYVRILSPLVFFSFINSPVSSVITIFNEQKIILFFDILKLILSFLGFYIGYKFYNSEIISISIFTVVGIIYYLFLMYYFLKISKQKP